MGSASPASSPTAPTFAVSASRTAPPSTPISSSSAAAATRRCSSGSPSSAATVQPIEEQSEAGIIYLSRFYRLREGQELPLLTKDGAGGDLGYLAFAGFYGDNRTFSITFGVPTGDRELMALRDEAAWEAAIRTLKPLEPWTQPDLADPITGVESMARLRNRIRRFVVDGKPVATGLVVIGDAAVATNPWYGKGCSLAGIAAEELSDALVEHGRDRVALAHRHGRGDDAPNWSRTTRWR